MKALNSAVGEESFVVDKWHRKYFQKDYLLLGPVMTLEYSRSLVQHWHDRDRMTRSYTP
jgi:hypothetical protein